MAAHLQHRVQAARAPAGQNIRGFHPSNLTQLFMFHSRGDCSLDILGASPAHTRDQDDVVEEEEAAVLPDTDVDVIDVDIIDIDVDIIDISTHLRWRGSILLLKQLRVETQRKPGPQHVCHCDSENYDQLSSSTHVSL